MTEKRGRDYEIGAMKGQDPYQKRTVKQLEKLLDAKVPHLKDDNNIDWKKLEDEYKEHGYKPDKEGNPWYKKYITIKFIRGKFELWDGRLLVATMSRLKQLNRKVKIKFLRPVRAPHRKRYFQSQIKNSPFSKEN